MQRSKASAINLGHWWRGNKSFDISEKSNRAIPKSGLELGFDLNWKQKIIPAWTYEIIRRLPYLEKIEKDIPADELQQLKDLEPYVSLTDKQRATLHWIFDHRPPVIVNNCRATPAGYTAPLPAWSFDLTQVTTRRFLKWMERWLEAEQRRCGLGPALNESNHKRRNQNQDYKLGDWRWVEASDYRVPGSKSLTKNQRDWRTKAKKRGLKYYKSILARLQACETSVVKCPPPVPAPEKYHP